MAQIDGELRRLNELLTNGRGELGADLVAEELAARVRMGQGYVWNNDTAGADLALASGLRLRIRADEPRASVALDVEWSGDGTEPRKQVGRWLPDATRAASAYLRAAGWRIEDSARYGQTVHLSATAADDKLLKDIQGAAEVVDKVAAKLSFK